MPNSIQVIPFCAPLPQSEGIGVVGTITLRGQSAVIWFGWGDIEPCENDETLSMGRAVDEVVRVGKGVFPRVMSSKIFIVLLNKFIHQATHQWDPYLYQCHHPNTK